MPKEVEITIKRSPWGEVDCQMFVAEGINFVTTPGHGGFKLDRKQNQQIPQCFRRKAGWYEEDCEAAIVIFFFPTFFSEKERQEAIASMMNYEWEAWEKHFNVTLKPGQSPGKDRHLFDIENAGNFVGKAAWGSWHEDVPTGMVGVCARRQTDGAEKYFLVPSDEYDQRRFGFVIDESRHQLWPTKLAG